MRKTFPVIFTLIALSILGILFIQITWLQGLFILSKNQLSDKINQSALIVSNDISKKMTSGLSLRLPKRGLSLNEEYHLHSFDESLVADVYSFGDLQSKITTALEKNGLKVLGYEFAFSDKKGKIEMMSKKFEEAYITPASCQKTIIAMLAYKTLGPEYKYTTKKTWQFMVRQLTAAYVSYD
jgi:two-component system phosphate regulon sensor histidine kinase PhoR